MKSVFVFKHEYIIMKKIHTFWIWTQTKYRLNSLNFIKNNHASRNRVDFTEKLWKVYGPHKLIKVYGRAWM